MRGGDHSYPVVQPTVWNVPNNSFYHRYFPANFLKLLIIPILPVGQLWSATCYTTTFNARLYIIEINSDVMLNAITYDGSHCQ